MRSSLTDNAPRTVAFLDIGSNSMHILVVRIESNASYAVLTRQKESIRLGDGGFATYELQGEAIDQAVLVGTHFADMARSFGADQIVAVATSATREAVNKQIFLDRLQQSANMEVRVISGREEARLIYLGVASGANLGDRSALFIDVGGGSTEITVGNQHEHHFLDTIRLGAIRLTNMFLISGDAGPVSPDRYELIQQHVRTTSVRTVQALREQAFTDVIGSSGTIMTLGDIAAQRFENRPLQRHDSFTHEQLRDVIDMLAGMTLAERLKVPGMSAKRADIIIGGAAVFDTLMEDLGLERITVSDRSVRDGLLIDYLSRAAEPTDLQDGSYRMHSVLRLGRQCRFDEDHARHVTELSLELFDTAREAGLHDLGDWERELLRDAAMLHDIGTFVSYSNHRSHSYYMIRNAELLGFDETEIGIIANTALFHKKTYPRKRHAEFAAIDKRSQDVVRVLCVLLRIAESLDRAHAGIVHHARLRAESKKTVVLELEAAAECELEIWAMEVHLRAFERSFGYALEILVRTPAAAT